MILSISLIPPDKAIEKVSYLYFNICVGMRMRWLGSSYVTTRNDKVKVGTFEQINDVASWLYKPDQLRILVWANVIFDLLTYVKSIIGGRALILLMSSPANFLKFSTCSLCCA